MGVPTGLLLVCGQDRHPRSLKVSGELDFAGRPGGGFVVEGVRVLRHPCRMPTSRLATLRRAGLSRWRVTFPDDAGIGATPHRCAQAASLRSRPG